MIKLITILNGLFGNVQRLAIVAALSGVAAFGLGYSVRGAYCDAEKNAGYEQRIAILEETIRQHKAIAEEDDKAAAEDAALIATMEEKINELQLRAKGGACLDASVVDGLRDLFRAR